MTEAIDRLELSERSVYAFVGWITSIFMYICFIIWAFVPDSYLISVGIEYYPPKYA
jgi:phosphatidylinositol N-acetylglucosaminyltransferase subunit P